MSSSGNPDPRENLANSINGIDMALTVMVKVLNDEHPGLSKKFLEKLEVAEKELTNIAPDKAEERRGLFEVARQILTV